MPTATKKQHAVTPIKWDDGGTTLRSLTGRTIAYMRMNEKGAGFFSLISEGRTVQRIDWTNEAGISDRVLLYVDGGDVVIVEPERAGDSDRCLLSHFLHQAGERWPQRDPVLVWERVDQLRQVLRHQARLRVPNPFPHST